MPEGAWQPENYPMTNEQADSFLRQVEALSLPDLDTLRHTFTSSEVASQMDRLDELEQIAKFAGRPGRIDALEAGRIQAQKVLLWRWSQESSLAEIALLEEKCAQAEKAIPECFLEAAADVKAQEPLCGSIPASWPSIVANAAFFIPEDIPIAAEGQMAADLDERLRFSENTDGWLCAAAPLWTVLGHTRPATGRAAGVYNVERLWIIPHS